MPENYLYTDFSTLYKIKPHTPANLNKQSDLIHFLNDQVTCNRWFREKDFKTKIKKSPDFQVF